MKVSYSRKVATLFRIGSGIARWPFRILRNYTSRQFDANVELGPRWRLAERKANANIKQITSANAFVERNAIRTHVSSILENATAAFQYKPVFSVIMPVYNVDPQYLREAINSVQQQIYPFWELCIADDASTNKETIKCLESLDDPRIKITYRKENGHICKASNDAAKLATGEFIFLMDNDDMLAPHALFEFARLLQENSEADVIYSDEDKLDVNGRHYDLHFKPQWSPILFLAYNYINHLSCIRRSLFDGVGGFRVGYEGAQDYDLLLRVTEQTDRIFHIPKVLYHWRAIPGSTALSATEKSIVGSSAYVSLNDTLERQDIPATVYSPSFAQRLNVPVQQLDFPDEGPSVDIIIPACNRAASLETCIESIINKTTYRDYNLLIIDNDNDENPNSLHLENLISRGIRVETVSDDAKGFSLSRRINVAVDRCESELILLLDDDIEVSEPKWLSRMVGYLQIPGVGVTGARLIYPDDTIQHAGIILGMGGGSIPENAFCRTPKENPGYFFLADTSRECSAVSGACLLTRRNTFLKVGGLDWENFNGSLYDVDLCLKVQNTGLRCVFVAGAELYHHESLRHGRNENPVELANFRIKYGGISDPYYSPNQSRCENYAARPDCTLDYTEYVGRRLRVVFLSHNLNYEGAPNILFDVARSLKSRGYIEPIIVSPCDGPQHDSLHEAGIEVHILPVREYGRPLCNWDDDKEIEQTVVTFAKFLKDKNPDLLVANVLNTFFAVEAAKLADIPAIWWIHESYDAQLMKQNLGEHAFPKAEKAFEKSACVLFVSNDTSDLYQRYNTKNNFKVINNSINAEELGADIDVIAKRNAKSDLGIQSEKKVIVSVGTICERKDQGTLVEAAKILAQTRDDFVLYLVGYRDIPPYGPYVKGLVEDNGLEEVVKLIPETREVSRYYQAADIFAFSSLNESYSLSILEAMAYGLPIVTTRCYGVAEQVRFGTNALEAEFEDPKAFAVQLAILLDDHVKRQQWGFNSLNIMHCMQTKEEMLDKHERLIMGMFQSEQNSKTGPRTDR